MVQEELRVLHLNLKSIRRILALKATHTSDTVSPRPLLQVVPLAGPSIFKLAHLLCIHEALGLISSTE